MANAAQLVATRPAVRQKRSIINKASWVRGAFDSDETREKMSDRTKAAHARGVYDGDETREKKSDATRAAWAHGVYTDEVRQKQSDAAKTRWARGDFDGMFESPTTIEIAVVQALEALGLAHECEYRPPGYSRTYDMLVYPDLLIEVQGDYWHNLPGRAEHDIEKAVWARGQGFVLVELWEADIREAMAAETIADFVRERIEAAYA